MADHVLKRPTVQMRTGLSRSTIYLMMSQGRFPKPIPLGARAVGWIESEIDVWLESRKAQRGAV